MQLKQILCKTQMNVGVVLHVRKRHYRPGNEYNQSDNKSQLQGIGPLYAVHLLDRLTATAAQCN